jgi:YD repeat-containing protein
MKKLIACVVLALSLTVAVPANATTVTYVYDALGRVVEVNFDNGIWIYYGYDAAGNRWIYAMDCTPGQPCN